MSTVVDIRNLGVSFSTDAGAVKAVEDVSISVERGEVLAIVGESGSGKTVTAKTILGLLPETATTGAVVLSNRGHPRERRHQHLEKLRDIRGTDVAMVFQASTALNPVYTVGWQIAEGLQAHMRCRRRRRGRRPSRSSDASASPTPRCGSITIRTSSRAARSSVVIAMALVLDPGLIVADEPTTAST